jgi:hypothetical protein
MHVVHPRLRHFHEADAAAMRTLLPNPTFRNTILVSVPFGLKILTSLIKNIHSKILINYRVCTSYQNTYLSIYLDSPKSTSEAAHFVLLINAQLWLLFRTSSETSVTEFWVTLLSVPFYLKNSAGYLPMIRPLLLLCPSRSGSKQSVVEVSQTNYHQFTFSFR